MVNRLLVMGCLTATTQLALAVDLPTSLSAAEGIDPTLASAAATRDAARENIAIAKSRLLPQVSAQALTQKMHETVSQLQSAGSASNSYSVSAHNYQISVRQGLYRPRDREGMRLAADQAEYGFQKFASARIDVWQRVVSAWLDVALSNEKRIIYAQTIESVRQAELQARKRLNAGDGTKDVVAEASAQRALAETKTREAEIDLKAKLSNFKRLTGIAAEDSWVLPIPEQVQFGFSTLGDLQNEVFKENPDLLAASTATSVNRRRAAQFKDDRYPTVDLVLSKNWAQNDTVNTMNQRYGVATVGIQLTVPLYDGGGTLAQVRQAEYGTESAEQDLYALRQKIAVDTEESWAEMQAGRESMHGAMGLIAAADEQLKAIRMGISAGVRTWAELSQLTLQRAQRQADLAEARSKVVRSQLKLMSNLPVSAPVWLAWVGDLSIASLHDQEREKRD